MKYNTKTIDKMVNQLHANLQTISTLLNVINWFEQPSATLPLIKHAPMRMLTSEIKTLIDRQINLLNDLLYHGIFRQDKDTQFQYYKQIIETIRQLHAINSNHPDFVKNIQDITLMTDHILISDKYVVLTDTGVGRSTMRLVSAKADHVPQFAARVYSEIRRAEHQRRLKGENIPEPSFAIPIYIFNPEKLASGEPIKSVTHTCHEVRLGAGEMALQHFLSLWRDHVGQPTPTEPETKRKVTDIEILAIADREVTKVLANVSLKDYSQGNDTPRDLPGVVIVMGNGKELYIPIPKYLEIENYKEVLTEYYKQIDIPESKIKAYVV